MVDLLTIFIIGFIILIVLGLSIRVVNQYERGVVFRLGKVIDIKEPSLRFLIPLVDRMVKPSLQMITMPIQSQKIITEDNVSIDVAAVAYFKIIDPYKAVVEVENYTRAVNQISQTTVRSVVGQFNLDEILSVTPKINAKIKEIIDEHSEPWGINVTTVEIKDITLPENMKRVIDYKLKLKERKELKLLLQRVNIYLLLSWERLQISYPNIQ